MIRLLDEYLPLKYVKVNTQDKLWVTSYYLDLMAKFDFISIVEIEVDNVYNLLNYTITGVRQQMIVGWNSM